MNQPESFHIYAIQKIWRAGAETKYFRVSGEDRKSVLVELRSKIQESLNELDRYIRDIED